MNTINMVDLKGQYQKIKSQIDEAVMDVMASSAFINGAPVQNFQQNLSKYVGANVVTCGNGTDALQIALMALELQPGDEVIVPVHTYVATAEVIALLKLKPVFVDVDPDLFTIDLSQVEKAITSKTKAIVPVHLYGQCVNMEELMQIANQHNLYVVEDAAQALGADYIFKDGTTKKAGTIGTIGCTSFFPSKNLGCYGDGGAIFINDKNLAAKCKMIANHGQSKKYHHDIVGCNSRLDTIQAAILDIKLKYLDVYCKARQDVAKAYSDAFESVNEIVTPAIADYTTHVFHQYTIRLESVDVRNSLQANLKEKGVPSMIYYPVPLHLQKAYFNKEFDKGSFLITEKLSDTVLSLPIHTEMEEEQLNYIIQTVKSYFNE